MTAMPKMISPPSNETSLDVTWAKRYYLEQQAKLQADPEVLKQSLPVQTALGMRKALPMVMAKALMQAEELLSDELYRNDIKPEHIDIWQITEDGREMFSLMIEVMAANETPDRLSVKGTRLFGQIRRKYTQQDGRVWGLVSIYMHNIGLLFAERLIDEEANCLSHYVQVLDDHLYMPIFALYEAAANHEGDSATLEAVSRLIPHISRVADKVCIHVKTKFKAYTTLNGSLEAPLVYRSSVRDTEMFLIYLCLCALSGSVQPVRQELFPLCVMLYPRLGVGWELVREMLQSIRKILSATLTYEQYEGIRPYVQMMEDIYSPAVLG